MSFSKVVVAGFVFVPVAVVQLLVVAKVLEDREEEPDLEMALDHLDSVTAKREYSSQAGFFVRAVQAVVPAA